jgi:hypothetical protein
VATWLDRSDQGWKLRWSLWTTCLGLALLFLGFARWPLAIPLAMLLLTAGFVLPMLVRCSVCGLRLRTSRDAREAHWWGGNGWLLEVDRCPACGDDGSATPSARLAWARSGGKGEPPYWSVKRILAALTLLAAFTIGGVVVAELRIKAWVKQQQTEMGRGPHGGR